MATDRARPAQDAGEREMLTGWLEHHRGILIWKCDDLTAGQLRRRAVPPSTLSLLGLVRHMAEVERGWFRQVFLGEDVPDLYDPISAGGWLAYGATVRDRGAGSEAGWAGRSCSVGWEPVLVGGRPCDLPGCAVRADP